jgi:hypothetical protein
MEDCYWSLYHTTEQLRIDGLRTIQLQGLLYLFAKKSLQEYMVWQEGTDEWVSAESIQQRLQEASRLISIAPAPPEFEAEFSQSFSTAEIDLNRNILTKTSGAREITKPAVPVEAVLKPTESSPEAAVAKELGAHAEAFQAVADAAATSPTSANPQAATSDANGKPAEARTSPRFLIAFQIFLTYNGRVLKNETINISVGGMRLKKPLDVDAEGSVEVTMLNQGKELNMQCKILKDEGAPGSAPVGASRLFIEKCNRMDILRAWILAGDHKTV